MSFILERLHHLEHFDTPNNPLGPGTLHKTLPGPLEWVWTPFSYLHVKRVMVLTVTENQRKSLLLTFLV